VSLDGEQEDCRTGEGERTEVGGKRTRRARDERVVLVLKSALEVDERLLARDEAAVIGMACEAEGEVSRGERRRRNEGAREEEGLAN
jgi:hypothetical protein